jgi:hypothetical protein
VREYLPLLIWTAVVTLIAALIAWLALKWIAVRIARRVGDLAERHIASTLERGLTRTGVRIPGVAADDVARRQRYLAQIDHLARLMDRIISLPIVGGVGLDAVLGLVPVAGDIISFAISSFIVIRAAQLGVPESLIGRLVAIQITDLLMGAVPVAGDLFDASYHADQKSAALIRQFVENHTAR